VDVLGEHIWRLGSIHDLRNLLMVHTKPDHRSSVFIIAFMQSISCFDVYIQDDLV
jgi:hypothetical protein